MTIADFLDKHFAELSSAVFGIACLVYLAFISRK